MNIRRWIQQQAGRFLGAIANPPLPRPVMQRVDALRQIPREELPPSRRVSPDWPALEEWAKTHDVVRYCTRCHQHLTWDDYDRHLGSAPAPPGRGALCSFVVTNNFAGDS